MYLGGDTKPIARERRPPFFTLYAGNESLEIERLDASTLELHAARGSLATPFEHIRDIERSPFRAGDRLTLTRNLTVEVREVDARRAPTRTQFSIRSGHSMIPGLAFRHWDRSKVAT